ncbi:hypothetical protein CDD83_2580 [Cordyceps sp. RAO-2017]|nr:hypothetical protein CDD83_2580 [Cordyceps sp. RAO-2017]
MMVATQGPGWAPATGARSFEDSARRHLAASDLLAPEPADAPPNPPFVFPARLSSPSSAPALYARAAGRRPMSAIEPPTSSSPSSENGDRPRRALALPAFSFNPGATLEPEPESSRFLSPPITPNSPSRPAPSPSRPARHGHRRGGSEFVGGSIRDGNSIAVMSTSPTKSESGFASSPGLAPPPRGHRRGLSGAISAHDLQSLQSVPSFVVARGSSAPNSPTAFTLTADGPAPPSDLSFGLSGPAPPCDDDTSSADGAAETSRPCTPVSAPLEVDGGCSPRQTRLGRARVGFSDKLEFIPRPLSLVSSDTSSTATARPGGHSVSGSISSVMSTMSPCGRESPAALSRTSTRDLTDPRPSTAGAVLERIASTANRSPQPASPKRRNSIPTLLDIVESQATGQTSHSLAAKTPKRWSFFGFESPFASSAVPAKLRPSSSSSSDSACRAVSGTSSSDHDSDSTETGREPHVESIHASKKRSKKKMVKGWAGSILPLKARGYKKNEKNGDVRPPTPPASVDPLEEDEEEDVEESVTPGPDSPARPLIPAESPGINCAEESRPKEEASYPMIDLDAALGPFNTPLPLNPEWEAAQRAAGTTGKRRMHSAQGMKGFSGPGMHYHRRAESAPDLPPIDHGRSGIPRFSSTSTMDDVFEEDEDGEEREAASTDNQSSWPDAGAFSATRRRNANGGTAPGPVVLSSAEAGIPAGGSPGEVQPIGARWPGLEPSGSEKPAASSVRAECSKMSLHDDVIVEEPPSIILCSASPTPGSVDAASSPNRLPGSKEASPAEIQHAVYAQGASTMAASPYATSHGSSPHPSPRTPISMDAQRISTAPSSVADKNSLQSLLMGEPGPEVRISVDYDMRSVNSSNSTMTRDSAFFPSQRMSQPSLREQRPVSVSSAAFGRRRSSLVSLSRLISSAHGERSKLSMEVTLDNEPESKKSRTKSSKTKQRLGRMMQFWKPNKDGAPT